MDSLKLEIQLRQQGCLCIDLPPALSPQAPPKLLGYHLQECVGDLWELRARWWIKGPPQAYVPNLALNAYREQSSWPGIIQQCTTTPFGPDHLLETLSRPFPPEIYHQKQWRAIEFGTGLADLLSSLGMDTFAWDIPQDATLLVKPHQWLLIQESPWITLRRVLQQNQWSISWSAPQNKMLVLVSQQPFIHTAFAFPTVTQSGYSATNQSPWKEWKIPESGPPIGTNALENLWVVSRQEYCSEESQRIGLGVPQPLCTILRAELTAPEPIAWQPNRPPLLGFIVETQGNVLDAHGFYEVECPHPMQGHAALRMAKIPLLQPMGAQEGGMHFPLPVGCPVYLNFPQNSWDSPVIFGVLQDSDHWPSPIQASNAEFGILRSTGGAYMQIREAKGMGTTLELGTPYPLRILWEDHTGLLQLQAAQTQLDLSKDCLKMQCGQSQIILRESTLEIHAETLRIHALTDLQILSDHEIHHQAKIIHMDPL